MKRSEKEIKEYAESLAAAQAAMGQQLKDAEKIHRDAGSNPDKLGSAYQTTDSAVATSFTSNVSNVRTLNTEPQDVPEKSGIEKFFSGIGRAVSGFFSKIFGGGDSASHGEYSIGNYNDREIRNNEYGLERPSQQVINKALDQIAKNPNSPVAIEIDAKNYNGNYVSQHWTFVPTGNGNVNMYPMSAGGYKNAFKEYSQGGEFTISNYRENRSDKPFWEVWDNGDKVQFSFDLTNDRVKNGDGERNHNRIHPRGKDNFTAGCGSPSDNCAREFERDMASLVKRNGGRATYTILRSEDRGSPYLNSNRSDNLRLSRQQVAETEYVAMQSGGYGQSPTHLASNNQSQDQGSYRS